MKVLIVEDELAAARRLRRLLNEYSKRIEVVTTLDSVTSTVEWLRAEASPDLIFLDVRLADGLSFEIFQQVEVVAPIVFCTAYDKYAIQAFKVNSIDYLLKPIESRELAAALAKFDRIANRSTSLNKEQLHELLRQLSNGNGAAKSRFLVRIGKTLTSIPVESIAYFYTEHKSVNLVTLDNQRFPIDYSLDNLEDTLSPLCFFRINRQVILSHQCIKNVDSEYGGCEVDLTLPSRPQLSVSRERRSDFKRWLDK